MISDVQDYILHVRNPIVFFLPNVLSMVLNMWAIVGNNYFGDSKTGKYIAIQLYLTSNV